MYCHHRFFNVSKSTVVLLLFSMHLAKEGQRKQQNKKKEKEKKRKIEGQKCSINLPLRNFPTCASSHNSLSDLP